MSLGSLEIDVVDPLNMGTTTASVRSLSRIISISNSSESSIPLDIETPINGFSIKTNRCPEILSPRQRCNITLQFSARGLYNGSHSSTILFESGENSLSIPLLAEITEQPDPNTAGTPLLKLSLIKNFTDVEDVPYRKLDIENNGDGTTKDLKLIVPSSYRIYLDRCKNNLLPREKCYYLIHHHEYRKSASPSGEVVVRYEYGDNQSVKAEEIGLLDSVEENVVINNLATYTAMPVNTKTEICSGEETFARTLVSCKDQFGIDLNPTFCPASENITYRSPMGESTEVNITGGIRFDGCDEGLTTQYPMRVACSSGYIEDQINFTCNLDSYTGQYQVVSNPVPNACNGSQSMNRPLISGTCFAQTLNQTVDDSFCPPTQSQSFQSPAGNIIETLTGGSKTVSCLEGQTSPSSLVSFTCDAGRYFSPNNMNGLCNQCSAGSYSGINALSCTACGTGQYQDTVGATSCKSCTNKPANALTVVYGASSGQISNTCPVASITSCNSGYYLQGGACVADPCLGTPAIGTICQDGSKYGGIYNSQKVKIMYANGQEKALNYSNANTACTNLGAGWGLPVIGLLQHIYTNRVAIGGILTGPSSNQGYYRSSTVGVAGHRQTLYMGSNTIYNSTFDNYGTNYVCTRYY